MTTQPNATHARLAVSSPMAEAQKRECYTDHQTTRYLHDIEEALLAHAVLILEQIMTRERPGNVSTDRLLKRRRFLQVGGVRTLLSTVKIDATQ